MSTISKYWRKFQKWLKKNINNEVYSLDDMVTDLAIEIFNLVHQNIDKGHKPTRGLNQLLKNWFMEVIRN